MPCPDQVGEVASPCLFPRDQQPLFKQKEKGM